MTSFNDLPSPEQMQQVVIISYYDYGDAGTLTLAPEQTDGSSTFIPWFGNDDKLLIGPIKEIETILILMEKVTGHEFKKTSSRGNHTIWERVDFLEKKGEL